MSFNRLTHNDIPAIWNLGLADAPGVENELSVGGLPADTLSKIGMQQEIGTKRDYVLVACS